MENNVFSEPRDLSICPQNGTCPARDKWGCANAHVHCAGCADVLYGYGGEGDRGEKVAGYEDATVCADCGREVCSNCIRHAGDDDPLCDDCQEERIRSAQLGDFHSVGLSSAIAAIKDSQHRVEIMGNAKTYSDVAPLLDEIQCAIDEYRQVIGIREAVAS